MKRHHRLCEFSFPCVAALVYAGLAGLLVATVVSPRVALAQPGPVSSQPSGPAAQVQAATEAYWTAERIQNAIPMPFAVEQPPGAQTPTQQTLAPDAIPGISPGWSPGSSTPHDPFLRIQIPPGTVLGGLQTESAIPQTSPPFVPPATPTDFGNYAPFQRWTWNGPYVTYPASTIGKLFFTQNGTNFVCSASVIAASTIATAGHCVHDGSNNVAGFSTNVVFCPSFNNLTGINTARGCWAWSGVEFVANQWFTSGASDRDYACIVTAPTGTLIANKVGNITGTTGRAWNFSSRQMEFSFGYPQAAPFVGNVIVTAGSPEWYEVDMFVGDGQVSKYIGNDMTGGSSGGPWWLGLRHPNIALEPSDTDGSIITDPFQPNGPFINGVNSHKRCNQVGCPPGSIFTQEMGSPQFRNTAGDINESEDVFTACFNNGGV